MLKRTVGYLLVLDHVFLHVVIAGQEFPAGETEGVAGEDRELFQGIGSDDDDPVFIFQFFCFGFDIHVGSLPASCVDDRDVVAGGNGSPGGILQIGIIQPITLRQIHGGKYQIVAGERRWRASQLAGLDSIPAYIRTIADENVMEMALVENIQREDLNAIEIALAYAHLLEKEGMTQERVAERVGKSRTAVTNYLRLLKLPAEVQIAMQKRVIDMGHARALLSLDSPTMQLKVFRDIQRNGASVRQVEEMVKKLKNGEEASLRKKEGAKSSVAEEFDMLKDRLASFLGAKVSLNISPNGKGKISIPFANEEELDHIMLMFDKMR